MKTRLLFLIGFFVYTQGYWERWTTVPAQIIIEILIVISALLYFRPKKSISMTILILLLLYGTAISLSTSSFIDFAKYIRYVVYTFIVFSLFRHSLSSTEITRFLKYILFFIFLQGIASVIHIFIFQERVEGFVGMMSSLGGTTATSFPALLTPICIATFFYAKNFPFKWYIILLIIVVSGFLVGYASEKRAIYMFLPIISLVTVVLCWLIAKIYHVKIKKKKYIFFTLFCLLCVPFYFLGVTSSRGYNYDLTGNESNMEILEKMIDYTNEYENSETQSGMTIGRSNSSSLILLQSLNDYSLFFHGRGFQSIKDESQIENSGIAYGFVGFTRDLFSAGVIFCLLTILLIVSLLLSSWKEMRGPFNISIRLALLTTFIAIHFFYSSDFTSSLKITFIIAFVVAFIEKSKIVNNQS